MKFLAITLLTFFLIRYLVPVILRLLLGKVVRKQMRNQGFAPPPSGQAAGNGQVNVDYVPPQPAGKKPPGFQGGEYVDFEEVK